MPTWSCSKCRAATGESNVRDGAVHQTCSSRPRGLWRSDDAPARPADGLTSLSAAPVLVPRVPNSVAPRRSLLGDLPPLKGPPTMEEIAAAMQMASDIECHGLLAPLSEPIREATPENCGVTAEHIEAIARVCRTEDVFVILRPSELATMRLIDQGFATKSMDIHDKSSDWGLWAGLVPCDQAFNKKLKSADECSVEDPRCAPSPHGEAQPVHLTLDGPKFETLLRAGHFQFSVPTNGCPGVEGFDHFHFDDKNHHTDDWPATRPSAATRTCILRSRDDGKVWWRARGQAAADKVPLWVWGYASNGEVLPVTGDYDMWMVAPHAMCVTDRHLGDKRMAERPEIESVRDKHGRSAATRFTTALIDDLNDACAEAADAAGKCTRRVFNHGAEAQNYSFTQELDKNLAVFCPGSRAPFVIRWFLLPGLLHDLVRMGYLATRNPKWLSGYQLGGEGMADANPSRAPLEIKHAAATSIQQTFRRRKGASGGPVVSERATTREQAWQKRAKQLKRFRRLGGREVFADATADSVHRVGVPRIQDRCLVLPDAAFSDYAHLRRDAAVGKALSYVQAQEAAFGRKGYVTEEDGRLGAVDGTRADAVDRAEARVHARQGAWRDWLETYQPASAERRNDQSLRKIAALLRPGEDILDLIARGISPLDL